jgi:hypothetical protein
LYPIGVGASTESRGAAVGAAMSAPIRRARRDAWRVTRTKPRRGRCIERAGTSGIGRCRSTTCDTRRPRRGYGADVPPLGDVARRLRQCVETLVSTYVGALLGYDVAANCSSTRRWSRPGRRSLVLPALSPVGWGKPGEVGPRAVTRGMALTWTCVLVKPDLRRVRLRHLLADGCRPPRRERASDFERRPRRARAGRRRIEVCGLPQCSRPRPTY